MILSFDRSYIYLDEVLIMKVLVLTCKSCTNNLRRLCSVCSSFATVSSKPLRSARACSRRSTLWLQVTNISYYFWQKYYDQVMVNEHPYYLRMRCELSNFRHAPIHIHHHSMYIGWIFRERLPSAEWIWMGYVRNKMTTQSKKKHKALQHVALRLHRTYTDHDNHLDTTLRPYLQAIILKTWLQNRCTKYCSDRIARPKISPNVFKLHTDNTFHLSTRCVH